MSTSQKDLLTMKHRHKTAEDLVRETKDMRDALHRKQIDQALENTFPASDPPAWY